MPQKNKIASANAIEVPTDNHSVAITLTIPFSDFEILEKIRKMNSQFYIQETIRSLYNAQLIAKGYKIA